VYLIGVGFALVILAGLSLNGRLGLGEVAAGRTALAVETLEPVSTRSIAIKHRYLLFPVKNKAPKQWVTVETGGKVIDDFEIEAGDGKPDWWAFLDVSTWQGQTLTVTGASPGWINRLEQADQIPGGDLYQEALRPQFHFTARRGWLNDPNGLVFAQGMYQLFFQHNPYGWNWGNMHWGRAVSRDLVHWEEVPEAVFPDPLGTIFSGSAVVDLHNTAGLSTSARRKPPIVLIYTAAGGTSRASAGRSFTQCLVGSLDGGKTWTKFGGNPVLKELSAGNRDPKVIWHAPSEHWIMSLYLGDGDRFALFRSTDLKNWEKIDDVTLPGDGECPNFFEMLVVGTTETKWVFMGAGGHYRVGTFDGTHFVPETISIPMNMGDSYYAAQVFTDLPRMRRVLVPWGRQDFPGMPFNQKMGLPVNLTLKKTAQGYRLRPYPINEIKSLRTETHHERGRDLSEGTTKFAGGEAELLDVDLTFEARDAQEVSFDIRGVKLSFDPHIGLLTCGNSHIPLDPVNGQVSLRVLIDRSSVDIFGNRGEAYVPLALVPERGNKSVSINVSGGNAWLAHMDISKLKSAWIPPKS